MKKNDIFSCILIMALVFLARTFLFTPVTVYGDSMNPSLKDKQWTIGLKVGSINRFDVVSFHAPDNPEASYIKRVIGLPGETVKYHNDTLYINNHKVEEPYLDNLKADLSAGEKLTEDFEYVVPANTYFVLGDNRQISKDSRIIGPISQSSIISNVKFSFYPFNEVGTLN